MGRESFIAADATVPATTIETSMGTAGFTAARVAPIVTPSPAVVTAPVADAGAIAVALHPAARRAIVVLIQAGEQRVSNVATATHERR